MSATVSKQILLAFVIVAIVSSHILLVLSKPTDGYKQTKIQCGNQDRTYQCQKCAKITKANNVYPNCCSETEDDVYKWCLDYIYYGHHVNFTQFK